MFKKLAEVVVCGAIGAAALYVVGKIAYQAGREMGHEESRYRAMHQNNVKTTSYFKKSSLDRILIRTLVFPCFTGILYPFVALLIREHTIMVMQPYR